MTESRMLKLQCDNPACGYTLRTTAKWITAGAPACSCGGNLVGEDGTVLAGVPVRTTTGRAWVNRALAGVAGGFIPVASYVLAHIEATQEQYLYALVGAALLFSAPTLAAWAQRWCDGKYKAWGFVALLEGVMIFSNIPGLNLVSLAILASINSAYAWERAKHD